MSELALPIEYHQRVFVAGQNRSGKSEFLNLLASEVRCQLFLLDTKGGEWVVPGVTPSTDIELVDWRQRVIHFVTQTTKVDEIEAIFAVLNTRTNIVVIVHELGDLCGHSTNRTPPEVDKYYSQGGAWGRGIYGGSQLPVDMPKRAKTEAQHIVVFVPGLPDEHLDVVARMLSNISTQELKELLAEVHRSCGPYSYVYFHKGAGAEPIVFDPLPAHMRSQIKIRRAKGVL